MTSRPFERRAQSAGFPLRKNPPTTSSPSATPGPPSPPPSEWRALFHRVLDNRLRDQARRRAVRRQWLALASLWSHEAETDALAQPVDAQSLQPAHGVDRDRLHLALDAALRALPPRQRQAFLLRVWEGLDVADTARAMGCGEGSVKTHLSRALAALRPQLEAFR